MKKNLVMLIALFGVFTVFEAVAQTISYEFKPPQNNLFVRWKDDSNKIHYMGYINGSLWHYDTSDDRQYFFTSDGKFYMQDRGRWYLDDMMYDTGDVRNRIARFIDDPGILGMYYNNFWKSYNASGNLRAELYHRGTERFLNVNCNIFIDNYQNRYWIDSTNGYTLKVVSANGRETMEVIEYNLNFTSWPAGLPPR